MSTSIIKFDYLNGAEVRAVEGINGEYWFVAKDVCNALELTDVSMSLQRIKEDEKLVQKLFVSGQKREITMINEKGLYRLIFTSNKPEAEKFQDWVYGEVLPTIRKTGEYKIAQSESKEIRKFCAEKYKESKVVEQKHFMQLTSTTKKNIGINGHKKKKDMTLTELRKITLAEDAIGLALEESPKNGYDEVKVVVRAVCNGLTKLIKGE